MIAFIVGVDAGLALLLVGFLALLAIPSRPESVGALEAAIEADRERYVPA